MRLLIAAAASLLVAITPSSAQPTKPATVDYAQDSSWLCLPGRADVCSAPLATVALNASGYGSIGKSVPAKDPPLDCFYVYPTVSRDNGMNSDLNMNEENFAAAAQAARFSSVCKVYAPKYRQMTVGAILAFSAGQDISASAVLAYSDVLHAWRNFLATRNSDRPFVLIGHSQGSLHLIQLIAREIETNPTVASRMKLAIIPGFDVMVPQGKLVGGDFKKTPLCSKAGETGCVIAWTSFRENNVPPAGAIFGIATQPGMTVACVNPAKPGAKDWVPLDSYWASKSTYDVPGGPIVWSTEGDPPTPWVRVDGLNSGQCVNDGQRGYFSIRTNADPKDKRTDRIGGEVGVAGMFIPGWGMHLADMPLVQGDLIRLVGDLNVTASLEKTGTGPKQATSRR
ncbi:DUF3089 domain-containing protein [Sphingomonas alba]|uniref:DUF3089 domain-containing protein n=1 Tax=Sphingomonas alba TaxID=2908208 RepID=A0ABT0RQI6_9SPHN|nr:DUF3089 domain-containing protein [Sphingomonas alba]MCL6684750.1 DUF3089 domain-containing protein [Sphingomonas alba]